MANLFLLRLLVLAFPTLRAISVGANARFPDGGNPAFLNLKEVESYPDWLPVFNTLDYDCWSKRGANVTFKASLDPGSDSVETFLIDWEAYRREFLDTVKDGRGGDWKFTDGFYKQFSTVLTNFHRAVSECPIGAITTSLLVLRLGA